jgi:hypothetical protein
MAALVFLGTMLVIHLALWVLVGYLAWQCLKWFLRKL